ncbi:MAG: cytochrome P450 [Anaerolineae bacterium]
MTDALYPPGPLDILRTTLRQQGNRLRFLGELTRDYGDFVHFRALNRHIYFANDPAIIAHVLVDQADRFGRTRNHKRALGSVLGQGLIVIDGEQHHRDRRLVQPAFHRKRIESYVAAMVEHTQQVIDGWQPGQVLRIDEQMVTITLRIVADALFHSEVARAIDIVRDGMELLQAAIIRQLVPVMHLPLSANRKAFHALHALHGFIDEMIAIRRASGGDQGDLLSMLLAAADDGSQLEPRQIRDEVMSLLMAGHETTANLLIWIWALLAENSLAADRLHEELDTVLGGNLPTLDDLPRLVYTTMVIKEGLRLYPPAWVISREVKETLTLGGYTLKQGSVVVLSPYLTHRHPGLFSNPDRFMPERFADNAEKNWTRFAYFPFGGGPHLCIGNNFAMMEAVLILAVIAQRYTLTRAADSPISMEPMITLRVKNGLPMRVERRVSRV